MVISHNSDKIDKSNDQMLSRDLNGRMTDSHSRISSATDVAPRVLSTPLLGLQHDDIIIVKTENTLGLGLIRLKTTKLITCTYCFCVYGLKSCGYDIITVTFKHWFTQKRPSANN